MPKMSDNQAVKTPEMSENAKMKGIPMEVQRTIPIIIGTDNECASKRGSGKRGSGRSEMRSGPQIFSDIPTFSDLPQALRDVGAAVLAFQRVQQEVSETAFELLRSSIIEADHTDVHEADFLTHKANFLPKNSSNAASTSSAASMFSDFLFSNLRPPARQPKPPSALVLHRACYAAVKGQVSAQMTCTAIRVVAGNYRSAWKKGHQAKSPFTFRHPFALWLIGEDERDASVRLDSSVRLGSIMPETITQPDTTIQPEDHASLPQGVVSPQDSVSFKDIVSLQEISAPTGSVGPTGILSLWTPAGRKRIPFWVPVYFLDHLRAVVRINSLTVRIERFSEGAISQEEAISRAGGHAKTQCGRSPLLRASLTVTLNVPDPDMNMTNSHINMPDPDILDPNINGPRFSNTLASADASVDPGGRPVASLAERFPVDQRFPIGIDRGAINPLVAVDAEDRVLFLNGREHHQRNELTGRVIVQVQNKLANKNQNNKLTHEKRDTRSLRRLQTRLRLKQKNRNRTFAQGAALALCRWAPPGSVFVFEDLQMPSRQPAHSGQVKGRLPGWFHGLLRRWVESKAAEWGIPVEEVPAAFTSVTCSRCGESGRRRGHDFACVACGHAEHADINAARNIRSLYEFPGLIARRRSAARTEAAAPEAACAEAAAPERRPMQEPDVNDEQV